MGTKYQSNLNEIGKSEQKLTGENPKGYDWSKDKSAAARMQLWLPHACCNSNKLTYTPRICCNYAMLIALVGMLLTIWLQTAMIKTTTTTMTTTTKAAVAATMDVASAGAADSATNMKAVSASTTATATASVYAITSTSATTASTTIYSFATGATTATGHVSCVAATAATCATITITAEFTAGGRYPTTAASATAIGTTSE